MLSNCCEVSHLLHPSWGADGRVSPTEGCSGLPWPSVTVSSLGLSLHRPWPRLPPHPTLIRVLPLNAPWNICEPGWAWEAGRGVLSPMGAGSLSPRQLWLLGPDCSPLSPSLGKALLAPGWHSCPSLAKGLSLEGPGHGAGGWGAGIPPDPWGWRGHLREPASGPAALPTFRPQMQEVVRGQGGRGCGQRVAGGQGR